MRQVHFHSVIGLMGVADDERPAAKFWARQFEVPMILLAIWILVEWYADQRGLVSPQVVIFTDWVIWVFFVLETSILTWFVQDKRRYLLSNWLNLVIIVAGLPVLWKVGIELAGLRMLRLLLILPLLLNLSSTIRTVLSRNSLGLTLAVTFFVIVASGLLIAGIDPAMGDFWDGIWWAWVTTTTVGYGDIVPSTPAGRLVAGLLMLLGLGIFSLITASFSAFLLSREEEKLIDEEEATLSKLGEIERRVEQMESVLRRIEGSVDKSSK